MKMERLNDNEVKEIAQMQKKIDAYESFISTIYVMLATKKTNLNYLVFGGNPFTNEMNKIWRFVKEKINEGKESSETA